MIQLRHGRPGLRACAKAAAFALASAITAPVAAQDNQSSAPLRSVPARMATLQEKAQDGASLFQRDLKGLVERARGAVRPREAVAPLSAAEVHREQERDRYEYPPFRSGEERRSSTGSLDTSLTVLYGERKAWRPETLKPSSEEVDEPAGVIDLRLRSYDALPVGPTLRVKAGGVLRIDLKNRLPVERPGEHEGGLNSPHDFNRTNLHTHGLHVSPVGNSDNVLLEVRPGEDHAVEVAVPVDHTPGTFWYHSHVHGSTAMQVSSGMAGALIVEPRDGDATSLDAVPGIRDAEERILLFQQISFLPETPDPADPGKKLYTLEDFAMAFSGWNAGKLQRGWRTTINGQLQPILRVKSGRMQRLRMIHAGVREPINVQVAPLPDDMQDVARIRYDIDALNDEGLREVAMDGIPLERVRKTQSVELLPGYRVDALLRLTNKTDVVQKYIMWDGLADSDVSLDPNQPDATKFPGVLAIIEVEPAADPAAPEDPWPSEHDFARVRRPEPIPAHEVLGVQTVEFRIGGGRFQINNESYDPAADPITVKLGRADEWQLRSAGGNHPFHIHVNPFYIVSDTTDDGTTTERGVWKDTLIVQPNRTYKLRTRYERYIGDFVIHCHILDHEDRGMMKGVRVVNNQYEVGTKLASPYLAPQWTLPDSANNPRALKDLMGAADTILVFLESRTCPSCNELVRDYVRRAGDIPPDVKVVFVVPGAPGETPPTADFPFTVVYDGSEGLDQFRAYGSYLDRHKAPLHGTFILDPSGHVRWREVSDRPYRNIDAILKELTLIKAVR